MFSQKIGSLQVCIGSRGRRKIQISANDLMSCCTDCQMSKGDGCKTGYTHKAWKYYQREGIVSGGTFASHSGCKPYPFYRSLFFETQESGECIKECKNGQSYDKGNLNTEWRENLSFR
jgi:cathepsin B